MKLNNDYKKSAKLWYGKKSFIGMGTTRGRPTILGRTLQLPEKIKRPIVNIFIKNVNNKTLLIFSDLVDIAANIRVFNFTLI